MPNVRAARPPWRTALAVSVAVLAPVFAACGTAPPAAPNAEPVDPPSDTTSMSQNVRTGTFEGLAGHNGSGTVRVRMVADTAVIEFQSDFSSTRVPGPFVYLNTGTDANLGDPIRIAALDSPRGAQTYAAVVPTNIDYEYVLVWCDPANVGVAAARLSP